MDIYSLWLILYIFKTTYRQTEEMQFSRSMVSEEDPFLIVLFLISSTDMVQGHSL